MRVIDSSSIVKYFSKEAGWQTVDTYMQDSVTLPLAIKELANALLKKIKKGELSLQDATDIVVSYQSIARFGDQRRLMRSAIEIANQNGLSIYDSLFVALSAEDRQGLVTSDEKQKKVAEKLGVVAILV